MNRTCAIIGVTMMMLGAVLGLVALWWWALNGMSSEVSTASAVTSVGLMFIGLFTAIAPVD